MGASSMGAYLHKLLLGGSLFGSGNIFGGWELFRGFTILMLMELLGHLTT